LTKGGFVRAPGFQNTHRLSAKPFALRRIRRNSRCGILRVARPSLRIFSDIFAYRPQLGSVTNNVLEVSSLPQPCRKWRPSARVHLPDIFIGRHRFEPIDYSRQGRGAPVWPPVFLSAGFERAATRGHPYIIISNTNYSMKMVRHHDHVFRLDRRELLRQFPPPSLGGVAGRVQLDAFIGDCSEKA